MKGRGIVLNESDQTLDYIVKCIRATGNDPRTQIYGYIHSGNACFITREGNARTLIKFVEHSRLERYVTEGRE